MTAGRIILGFFNPALDANGAVLPNARLTFYQNKTTTLLNIYSAPDLITPLPNPLSADSAGRFVEIWADSTDAYSVICSDKNGTPQAPSLDDIYSQVTGGADLTLSNLTDYDAARTNLGLEGVNGLSAFGDGGTIATTDAPATFSQTVTFQQYPTYNGTPLGFLGVPVDSHDISYTLVLEDRGRGMRHNSASNHTYTVPAGVFSAGDVVAFANTSTGLLTIAPDTGVLLYIAGTTSSASVSIPQNGIAVMTCWITTPLTFIITGNVS